MVKKRKMFDINFELDAADEDQGVPRGVPSGETERAPETKARNIQGHPLQNHDPVPPARRGPMAAAITESAEANADRARAEAAIRAENDGLAHEHVRLKKLGLITDLLPTAAIKISKLTRDRSSGVDPELEELKASILAVGLSNPIRVEQMEDGTYELIQGFRRLSAFREIAQDTGDKRYLKIPAALVPRGEPLAALYRKMVDENLVRKDISFGEMAQLALSYAEDTGMDAADAVYELYASARKQKRTYIRQFARMIQMTGGAIRHIEDVPRALGVDLIKLLEAAPERADALIARLRRDETRSAEQELQILRDFLAEKPEAAAKPDSRPVSTAKTSLRLARPEGEARVIASDGRIDLRLDRDFSSVSKARLQAGIEALLRSLDEN